LRAENVLLKKQVADLITAATNSTASDGPAECRFKIGAAADRHVAIRRADPPAEKLALENRLSQNPEVGKAPSAAAQQ